MSVERMNSEATDEYTDSYIAYLDILGFKAFVKENTCSEVMEIFKNYKIHLSETSIGTSININHEEVNMKVMSDSICFYISTEKEYALPSIIAVCQALREQLLHLKKPILPCYLYRLHGSNGRLRYRWYINAQIIQIRSQSN